MNSLFRFALLRCAALHRCAVAVTLVSGLVVDVVAGVVVSGTFGTKNPVAGVGGPVVGTCGTGCLVAARAVVCRVWGAVVGGNLAATLILRSVSLGSLCLGLGVRRARVIWPFLSSQPRLYASQSAGSARNSLIDMARTCSADVIVTAGIFTPDSCTSTMN